MTPARIAELLAPFLVDSQLLPRDDVERISTYIDILMRWNARINLTAIRAPEEIVTRHFGESLFAARILFPKRGVVETAALAGPSDRNSSEDCTARALTRTEREQKDAAISPLKTEGHKDERVRSGRAALQGRVETSQGTGALAAEVSRPVSSVVRKITLADIGSGAGFPGIPIKLWHPDLALTLIESNHKKATFLREVARALTLTDVNILSARAETLAAGSFEMVTLRAVERFESILPVAARLVVPGGRLALLIGASQVPLAQSILVQIHGFLDDHLFSEPVRLSHARVILLAERSA
jgi:16S rRNA G527 N7-methylase RsmG